MFDFNGIMNIKKDYATLMANHPKLAVFFNDLRSKGYSAGQEIAIAVRYPDGTEFKTGIRLQESDLNLINDIKSMSKN